MSVDHLLVSTQRFVFDFSRSLTDSFNVGFDTGLMAMVFVLLLARFAVSHTINLPDRRDSVETKITPAVSLKLCSRHTNRYQGRSIVVILNTTRGTLKCTLDEEDYRDHYLSHCEYLSMAICTHQQNVLLLFFFFVVIVIVVVVVFSSVSISFSSRAYVVSPK